VLIGVRSLFVTMYKVPLGHRRDPSIMLRLISAGEDILFPGRTTGRSWYS